MSQTTTPTDADYKGAALPLAVIAVMSAAFSVMRPPAMMGPPQSWLEVGWVAISVLSAALAGYYWGLSEARS